MMFYFDAHVHTAVITQASNIRAKAFLTSSVLKRLELK